MRSGFQFSEHQMKNELIACIRHLLSAGEELSVMRTFLQQTCLLQGATGGLVGLNASLATQPGGSRSDFKINTVGILESELVTHHLHDFPNVASGGWDELVSVVTKLGWSPSQPRFSKFFGQVGDENFCHIFGYAIRSNFGDVLGFVLYSTAEADPFAITDQNTTLVAQLFLYRLLELTGVRQCAFRKTGDGIEFYETTGSMFPAIDEVYSQSVHSLNGVLATVAMQSQLIIHEDSLAEKVNGRAQKILASLEQAETYLNRSESMSRIYNGRVDALEFSDLVDLASSTGALQPIYEIAVQADGPIESVLETPNQKLIMFFLYHNVVRLLTIRSQTSAGKVKNNLSEVRMEFAFDVQNRTAVITGILPADPEVDLNTDMAREEREYQLGRRLNTPRRIIEQVLRGFGGTLSWETVDLETLLIMRVPMQNIPSSS
jgi:hypothetical protein